MAPTLPSIMSEGANDVCSGLDMGEGLPAKELKSRVVEHPPIFDNPQCPWLVYSQRHTSVNDEDSFDLLLEGSNCPLDDPIIRIGLLFPSRPFSQGCQRGPPPECLMILPH